MSKVGQLNPNARITADDVRWLHLALANGLTQKEIAAVLGVSQTTVSLIARGERWPHLHPTHDSAGRGAD